MNLISHSLLLTGAAALTAAGASAQTLIADDFEVDSSADYTVADDGSPDGTSTFAFDYIAAGIPLAPRSAPGDLGGLRLTANDGAGASDARTAFHNTSITADAYRMTVDVYMNFGAGGGTTEFGNVGVGGDGVTTNSIFLPITGSGAFIAFTGDGGSGSDFRWFRAPANTPAGETDNTTLPNSHPSYLGRGSNGTGAFFQSLFPSPPSTVAGSPGNIWTTVTIDVDNVAGLITFSFDGELTYRGRFGSRFDGLVSLGIADVFSSVSSANNFTLYDNLLVEARPALVTSLVCAGEVNSTGASASLEALGSIVAADNDLTLSMSGLPDSVMGLMINTAEDAMSLVTVTNVGGGQGTLCIGSFTLGRSMMVAADAAGLASLDVDLTAIPTNLALVPAMAGDTYHWQFWYRDTVGGMPTSNLTDAISVTFQ